MKGEGEFDSALELWLAISQIPSLYERAGILSNRLGGPAALWTATKKELIEAGCSKERADRIFAERRRFRVPPNLLANRLAQLGISAVCIESDDYPKPLKQIYNPPRLLFFRGKSIGELGTAIAVVGSRRATAYGKAMAESISEGLSRAGVTVVSGLACGVDTSAHLGALRGSGGTTAVLGSGLDVVYPRENWRLLQRIAANGWVISEYPPGTPPRRHHFPARNRIIAGLSVGVVVVEAAEKSGALITADFALEQGKDVFAVPGSARSALSRGTNSLLKQGAFLAENAADILDVFGIKSAAEDGGDRELDELERKILDAMGWEPVHADEITHIVGEPGRAASLLAIMEIKGAIKRECGGMYLRIR